MTADETPTPGRDRVAVVVFAEVTPGAVDPYNVVRRLVEAALCEPDGFEHPVVAGGVPGGRTYLVRVHDVVTLGSAARNDFVRVQLTDKAYRRFGDEETPDA